MISTTPRRRVLRAAGWTTGLLAVATLMGAQMGLFSGKRPEGLGYTAGRFAPCSWKPNCVNSTADPKADAAHFIEPIAFQGDAAAAWRRLSGVVKGAPRVAVLREDARYLRAEFSSKLMGYTDDVEFALDAAASRIHVRSASRLGIRDFGVNRARIEDIRTRFTSA